MARKSDVLRERILGLLEQQSRGLEVTEIITLLGEGVSTRGIRNLLNELSENGEIIKKRKENHRERGIPPFEYFHVKNQELINQLFTASQPNLFEDENIELQPRNQLENERLNPEEKKRDSVLSKIAQEHLRHDKYARAIIDIAPQIAKENPIDLVIGMVKWVINDLNKLGNDLKIKWQNQDMEEVKKITKLLEERLTWARNYFQSFWRLDRPLNQVDGILYIPKQPKEFFQGKDQGKDQVAILINEEKARDKLSKRIIGNQLIEVKKTIANQHKAVIGTDASITKIPLLHTQGSFIPPDPVVVTNASAAMIIQSDNFQKLEYQDFDIFPDRLQEYKEYEAAENGLVLSPHLITSNYLNEETFNKAYIVAMDLRQYEEDFNVATRKAKWRPVGEIENLAIKQKPSLIFRDGRIFPAVHRINFFESEGLYGGIVRKEIERFADVIDYTFSNPQGEIIYGATVKNPELSWLSPLVFWYLHIHDSSTIDVENVYKYVFRDTVVSHLLFLGVAKNWKNYDRDKLFITCQVIRRFSDIAFVETSLPVTIHENFTRKVIDNEDSSTLENWHSFILQRIQKKEEDEALYILEPDDYNSFIYLCQKVGVMMFYAAPTLAYEQLSHNSSEGGHFLIPRLEVAINLNNDLKSHQNKLDKMLSWLTAERWGLDSSHTQSEFDSREGGTIYPILVPDVVLLAHEVATFTCGRLGEEVQDEIRKLVAELRQRMDKRA